MALNIPGLVSASVFFTLTLAAGIWASWKSKKDQQNRNPTEMAIVGGQCFHWIFYCNSHMGWRSIYQWRAEIIYLPSKGLLWVQAPGGFALSLVVGGYFFVNPMRSKNYVTVTDPIQATYGNMMGSLLFIPPVLGEVFWFAAILASTGATITVILDILALWLSLSQHALSYFTLYWEVSVAYTNVIQTIFITLSLCTFSLVSSATENIYYTAIHRCFQDPWIEKIGKLYLGKWLDDFSYLLCCALFTPSTNTYSSAAGFLVGLLLRLLAGEPALSISPVICYPVCSLVNGIYSQLFPFKTFTTLLTFGTILAVSNLAKVLFQRNLLPRRWDVCNVMGGTGTLILLQQLEKQRGSPTIALEENRG